MPKPSWSPVADHVLGEAAASDRAAAKAQDEAEAMRAAGRTNVQVWRRGTSYQVQADPAPYIETDKGPR